MMDWCDENETVSEDDYRRLIDDRVMAAAEAYKKSNDRINEEMQSREIPPESLEKYCVL